MTVLWHPRRKLPLPGIMLPELFINNKETQVRKECFLLCHHLQQETIYQKYSPEKYLTSIGYNSQKFPSTAEHHQTPSPSLTELTLHKSFHWSTTSQTQIRSTVFKSHYMVIKYVMACVNKAADVLTKTGNTTGLGPFPKRRQKLNCGEYYNCLTSTIQDTTLCIFSVLKMFPARRYSYSVKQLIFNSSSTVRKAWDVLKV